MHRVVSARVLADDAPASLLHKETMEDPKAKQHPKVLFLSTALPAQSESIYSCHIISILEVYLRPCRTVSRKYLNTCFTTIQCVYLSWLINWLSALTAQQIFGLVLTKYINDPISYLYRVGSISSESEEDTNSFFIFITIGVAMGLQFSIPNFFNISTMYFP